MKRREFFRRTTPILAAPLLLHGMKVRGLAKENYLYDLLPTLATTDRVLVIIQLEGGNDGLNMVIPIDDDRYYEYRPNLAIAGADSVKVGNGSGVGLHPTMGGIGRLYDEGRLAILQNIGYDRMNLSHFTGTEIWNTASDGRKETFQTTGWVGRYLQGEYPDFPDQLPDHPPAIEISPSTSSIFTVVGASIGMSLTDPDEFYQLVGAGPNVSDDVDVTTLAGREWEYVDRVNSQSLTFADSVQAASIAGNNVVSYPDTPFAASLGIVARLVAGGLQTRIYKVTLGNFDTHGNQGTTHARLLQTLSDGIAAFQDDLVALGIDHRVVGMTYSEFGRRAKENGSGTDHGTAAPHFVFGSMISGGRIYGGPPQLSQLDAAGNLPHELDFPCYYASVIGPLFELPDNRLQEILPYGLCDRDGFVPLYGVSAAPGDNRGRSMLSPAVAPNPVRSVGRLAIPSPFVGQAVRIQLVQCDGRRVKEINLPVAPSSLPLHVDDLPSGSYSLLLRDEGGEVRGRTMLVVLRDEPR